MAEFDLESLNALQGWSGAMNLVYTAVSADHVACEFDVAPHHLQPFGLVHGGVHCGVVETLTSVGALMYAHHLGMIAVGLENHTSFVRATKAGRLFAEAKPIARGRTNQLWEAWIRDDKGRVVAQGRVRLQNVTDRGDAPV